MVLEEFTNVGPKAVVMLCNWSSDCADALARCVVFSTAESHHVNDYLLWLLGQVAIDEHCSILEKALDKSLGQSWKDKYLDIKKYYSQYDKMDKSN